jgi:uncharacterized Ntn-hydrolase superfamily protein
MTMSAGLMLATAAAAQPAPSPTRPVHTYSIVARHPVSGDFGVAVQSHWFQVGAVVPWAEAGVGAVATQSFVEPSYGPRGLALLAGGWSASEALGKLIAADEQSAVRQVAMVDAAGRVAAWTGERCIAAAGHATGEGYSVQANLMERPTVWPAMAAAYEAALADPAVDFAGALLAALEAAEAEGGDIRGRQSAALLVVRAKTTGDPWRDRLVDLRVDDHPAPLDELGRLLGLARAYAEMNAGDEAVATGDFEAALGHYSAATAMAPGIVELPYWQAVTLFAEGHEAEALAIFRRVFAEEPRWVEVTRRLAPAGLLPDDPAALARILAVAPQGSR